MSLFKKLSFLTVVLGLLCFGIGTVKSDAAELYGSVSFYDGLGKRGSDGKILTKNDVAVSYSNRFLPKGTLIQATNVTANIKRTLYKWDYGSFGGNVILDLQRPMFTEMGGTISSGYFKGYIVY